MNSIITTNQMSIDGREFILVDVKNGLNNIGITSITSNAISESERQNIQELFFVGDEPVIAVARNSRSDAFTNKMIAQLGSISNCGDGVTGRLRAAVENYFTNSQSLSKSVQPILELLCDGVYVVHTGKMMQSDGAGNYFWNAYTIRHEVNGTSDYNSVIGMGANYTPCFLIPGCSPSEYSESSLKRPTDRIKSGKPVGGICFHLTGMFSVLLSGHANATATLTHNAEFYSIIIEPIRDLLYESAEAAVENNREPMPIALSCPYVKIPLEQVPESVLESFLMQRRLKKPINYDYLKKRAGKTHRSGGRRAIPQELYDKAEALPDCKMIESANAIQSLSDEQIQALLNGETEYEGNVIVNTNYYNSVVIACNYLQYTDFERFIDFALSILGSPDLSATHKYIAERVSNIMNSKIYRFFKTVRDNGNQLYSEVMPTIEEYIDAYDSVADRIQRESHRMSKIQQTMQTADRLNTSAGLAKMEQFIKKQKG